MNAFTSISGKGQVVIPKGVRDRLQLSPGDRLEVIERPDGVLLRRQSRRSSESFEAITKRIRSRVPYDGPAVLLEEMGQAIARMWADGGPRWNL